MMFKGMRIGWLPAWAALVALISPSAVLGNGPNVGFDAGGLVPLASDQIQLAGEFVTVPIEGGRVSCQYDLRNLTDERKTVTIGFVTDVNWEAHGTDLAAYYGNADIEVRRGSQRIPIHLKAVAKDAWAPFLRNPPDSLPVWDVTFEPHQDVILNISYEFIPSTGCDGDHCSLHGAYHARSASLWAGKLEYATIRFEFSALTSPLLNCCPDADPCLSLKVEPGKALRTSRGYVWEFRDWEPDTDFSLQADWVE
ncbi:hypothetical protein KJ682_03735 [bacterium]|nr:hypothetical protein [bacterium]